MIKTIIRFASVLLILFIAVSVSIESAPNIDDAIKTDIVVVFNPKIKTMQHANVALLPFIYNKSDGTEADFQKTVTENYRGSFETYFIKTGFDIIDRDQIDKILAEQQFGMSGISRDNQKKIGKLLNADTIVIAQINNYDMVPVSGTDPISKGQLSPSGDKKYNGYIALTLKAIHVETGVLLWKMNLSATITDMPGNNYNVYYDRALKLICSEGVNLFIREYSKMNEGK
ncbi:MAG: hypothetical protein KAZ87_12950 [Spirochaetes bacterium]|nr:hypothetical protein [Spirochaetota bacterium]